MEKMDSATSKRFLRFS